MPKSVPSRPPSTLQYVAAAREPWMAEGQELVHPEGHHDQPGAEPAMPRTR